LFWLPLLLFLEKKTTAKLSQYIFIGLDIKLKTLRPKIKFLHQIACVVVL
jgi:hypothetical protein